MVVLLSTVNLLKEYALVQGITQGGPGLSTTFIIQYIFDKGFNQMQYGYASAISTVVMIIFALIAFAQFKVNNGVKPDERQARQHSNDDPFSGNRHHRDFPHYLAGAQLL